MIENIQGMDEQTKQKLMFYIRQWINALSPSNFIATNPEVLRKTMQTGGKNLIDGMQQLSQDIKQSIDTVNISITDHSAFNLGENLAVTPGKVVFQNSLFSVNTLSTATSSSIEAPLTDCSSVDQQNTMF